MKFFSNRSRLISISLALSMAGLLCSPAMAHCDSMDGPVVKDAQRAIAEKQVAPVLKWVNAEDETSIRKAFDMTLAVRGESEAARTVADTYFFETLVRIHRATEGEDFTGLKPAGSANPAYATADRALINGDVTALADKVSQDVRKGIMKRFVEVHEKQRHANSSVAHGREYVDSYVQYTHFLESVEQLSSHGAVVKHRESSAVGH